MPPPNVYGPSKGFIQRGETAPAMSRATKKPKFKPRVVEKDVPLSRSVLWDWMKAYYQDGGVAVWTDGDIPFHITNTPLLAAEWGESIFVLIRDFHRMGLLNREHPIEIYEIGPGTGRHAYYLLRELERLEERSQIFHPEGYRFTLQLAELGAKGLKFLSKQPQLLPYLSTGRLRLSLFDISTDMRPKIWPETPSSETKPSPNPVFVVANYVLDSLPYDLVRFYQDTVSLGCATVSVRGLQEGQKPSELEDLGEKIELSFSYRADQMKTLAQEWRTVLSRYKGFVDTYFPFPTGSMKFLDRLRGWSETGAVLLVADKSFVNESQMRDLEEPELVPHGGGFSFNANLHALGWLAEEWGGLGWHTSARDGTLDLSHIIVPAVDAQFPQRFLEMGYRMKGLEAFHAVDRFRIKESVDEAIGRPSLRLSLDLLRLSGFDPQVFYELSDHILLGLDDEDVDEEAMLELESVLHRCLVAVFPVGEDVDMAFEIGRVAYRIENYELSHQAFELSLEQFGPDAKTYFNVGLGWYYRQKWEKAEQSFSQALMFDPEYEDADSWILKSRRHLLAESAAKKQDIL